MVFESVRMSQIVAGQGGLLFGVLPKWGVLVQPLGFVSSSWRSTQRRTGPLRPAGRRVGAGGRYHTEYGSFKFSMFMMAEYLHMVVARPSWRPSSSAGAGPVPRRRRVPIPGGSAVAVPPAAVLLLRIGAFVAKVLFFAWLYVWVRWTIPGSGTTR